jgi:hypothetical protein
MQAALDDFNNQINDILNGFDDVSDLLQNYNLQNNDNSDDPPDDNIDSPNSTNNGEQY